MRKLLIVLSVILLSVPALAQNHTGYRLPEEPKRAKYVDYPSLTKGFWFAAQATAASSTALGRCIQADFIAGFRADEFFRVGLGVSPQSNTWGFSLPLYVDFRGNLISQESRMIVPYWSFDAGYAFGKTANGIYLSPTLGARFVGPRNDFLAGLTYILQGAGKGFKPGHAIGLRIGFEF